jgi:hypothetical protein
MLGTSCEPTVDDCGSAISVVTESANTGSVGKLSQVQRRRTATGTTKEAFQTRTNHRPIEVQVVDQCPPIDASIIPNSQAAANTAPPISALLRCASKSDLACA